MLSELTPWRLPLFGLICAYLFALVWCPFANRGPNPEGWNV
jgi:hypothetical protein